MTIYYLYVKTHKITGLKYLGYTARSDYAQYLGSGVYWKRHLKKYGKDITTELISECHSKNDIKEQGIYYSTLWNVVDATDAAGNKVWANLKPEEGDGGCIGYQLSPESIAKQLATKKLNGTMNSNSPESNAKRVATRLAKGKYWTADLIAKRNATVASRGLKINSPESISKCAVTKKENGTGHYQRLVCPRCGREAGKPNYIRHHGDNCKIKI